MNARAGLVVLLLMLGLPASALACPDAVFDFGAGPYAPGDVITVTGDKFDKPAPSVSVTLVWRSRDGSRLETLATVPVADGKTLPATTITIPSWAAPGDTLRGDAYDASGQLNGLSNRAVVPGFLSRPPTSESAPAAEESTSASAPATAPQAAPALRRATPPRTTTAQPATAPAPSRRPHGSRNVPKRDAATQRPQTSAVTDTAAPPPLARKQARAPVAAVPETTAPAPAPRDRARAGQTALAPTPRHAAVPALAWRLRHDDAPDSARGPALAHGRPSSTVSTRSTPLLPIAAMLVGLLLAVGGAGSLVLRRRQDGGRTPDAGTATALGRDHVELELQAIIAAAPAPAEPSVAEREDSRPLALTDA